MAPKFKALHASGTKELLCPDGVDAAGSHHLAGGEHGAVQSIRRITPISQHPQKSAGHPEQDGSQ